MADQITKKHALCGSDGMKPKAIIVDLDGTLCNTDHRQHLVQAKKWNEFYDALVNDPLHEWCAGLIAAMREQGVHALLVSGRPDSHWEQTAQWLSSNMPQWDGLFMRKTGDYRKDCIVKEEIYRKDIEPRFEVLFCVDDRKQVVDMWRSIGLTCLQCAEGNF